MTQEESIAAIGRIKQIQENIAVTLGIIIGVILSIYFFTMSELVNHGLHLLVEIQVVTSILFVIMLVFIRRIAFFVTRALVGRKSRYRAIFASLKSGDMDQSPEALAEKVGN